MELKIFYNVITVIGGISLATMFVISLWSIYPVAEIKKRIARNLGYNTKNG